jgi:AcrR family transcriptional regulator
MQEHCSHLVHRLRMLGDMAGIRERVRAELTTEIKRLAREQVAVEGATALSLRAIARDLEMASSAIYRYFASRDELLTALIVDAYDALGDAVEASHAAAKPSDLAARWAATAHGARRWALENPSEYGLIFGTPVPGYKAPDDTIAPATRYTAVLLQLLVAIDERGSAPDVGDAITAALRREYKLFRQRADVNISDGLLLVGLSAWSALFGAISFEVFGHLRNVIDDRDAHFTALVRALGRNLIGS